MPQPFLDGWQGNFLRETSDGNTIATYKHNAIGERLVKTVGATTTYFHYDEKGHLIAETQPDNALEIKIPTACLSAHDGDTF